MVILIITSLLLLLLGHGNIGRAIALKETVEIPHLEAELIGVLDVYEAVKTGISYQAAAKNRPASSTNTVLKDIGSTVSILTNISLSSQESS